MISNCGRFFQNLKRCSRQFLVCCDIGLADIYLDRCVLHHYRFCCFQLIGNGKFHIFRNGIAIRCCGLAKDILSGGQALNGFRCLTRYPLQLLAVNSDYGFFLLNFFTSICCCFHFLQDLKCCSRQFFSGSDIGLADSNLCCLILHGNRIDLSLFSVYTSVNLSFFNGKGNRICNRVTSRSLSLNQFIAAVLQASDGLHQCIRCGGPSQSLIVNGSYDITVLILYLKGCSRKILCKVCQILLGYGQLAGGIFHGNGLNLTVSAYLKGNLFRIFVTIRHCGLSQSILLTGFQDTFDIMRLTSTDPGINEFAVCISDFQFRSRQFCLIGCINLGNLNLRQIVDKLQICFFGITDNFCL